MKSKTHDCYKCKFREKILGSAHSMCVTDQVKNGVKITSTYAVINGWTINLLPSLLLINSNISLAWSNEIAL